MSVYEPAFLFSLVQFRPHVNAPAITVGVVLFGAGGPWVRLAEIPKGVDDAERVAMAARALCNRLRSARPRGVAEVRAFMSLEANEVQLASPLDAPDWPLPPEVMLSRLYHEHVESARSRFLLPAQRT